MEQVLKYCPKPQFNNNFRNVYLKQTSLITNYLSINIKGNIVHQYSVKFNPEIATDNYPLQKEIYNSISKRLKELNFSPYYTTGYIIFSCSENAPAKTSIKTTCRETQYDIEISLTKKEFNLAEIRTLGFDDLMRKNFLESLLRKIISLNRGIIRFDRQAFFSWENAKPMDNTKNGKILPGYQTASVITELGLHYRIIDKNKCISGITVIEKLQEIQKKNQNGNFKEKAKEFITGKSVLATYGGLRTYKIGGISFDKNVLNTEITIKNNEGVPSQINLKNYYKQQYDIDIKDTNQPLLIEEPRKQKGINNSKDNSETSNEKNVRYIIPELVYLTEMSDEELGSQHGTDVRRGMISKTKLNPGQKMNKIEEFLNLLKNKTKISKKLRNIIKEYNSPNEVREQWGLEIGSFNKIDAKILKTPQIKFNNNQHCEIERGKFRYNKILNPINLRKNDWICITVRGKRNESQKMLEAIQMSSKNLGIYVEIPNIEEINARYPQDFIEEIKNLNLNNYKIIIVSLDRNSENFYTMVKEYIILKLGKPSQFMRLQNYNKQQKNGRPVLSYYSNILIQMENKLNSELFNIEINNFLCNHKRAIIMGLDCIRTSNGIKYSLTSSISRCHGYYCNYQIVIQNSNNVTNNNELNEGLHTIFRKCLDTSFNFLHAEPTDIFIYRQGGNEKQNEKIFSTEIPIILNFFSGDSSKGSILKSSPKINFCVVNRKTSSKFFENGKELKNPESGTVIDSGVTSPGYYEFYLQPQYVNQGTANPVYFHVLYDTTGVPIEIFEEMTYKLTYYYTNWNGPIPIPAPLQYAIRANSFVNKILNNKEPVEGICNSHFYL